MCFGGGGGGGSQPNINVMPQAPVVKMPEAPKQLVADYKPLQPQNLQTGIQQAGTSQRQSDPLAGSRMSRRRGLSSGVALSQSPAPTGGINL